MERRQFRRLSTSLPIEYQVCFEDSEDVYSGQAVIRNISIGGLYFVSDLPPGLKRGNIAHFTFKTIPAHSFSITSEIRGQGLVKRIDYPVDGVPDFGVAIEFLSGPILG